jgi:hypothetical protein
MNFLLLLMLIFLLAALGAVDFAARRLLHAVFEAWAALFLLFALATGGIAEASPRITQIKGAP